MRRSIVVAAVLSLATWACEPITFDEDACWDFVFGCDGGGGLFPVATDVSIRPDTLWLAVGEAAGIEEAGQIVLDWSSTDDEVARVDTPTELSATARVEGVGIGEAWVVGGHTVFADRYEDSVRVIVR